MFTKKDLEDYCSQIIELEEKMAWRYHALSERLSHEKYKKVFERMAQEEKQHMDMASNLLAMLVDPTR